MNNNLDIISKIVATYGKQRKQYQLDEMSMLWQNEQKIENLTPTTSYPTISEIRQNNFFQVKWHEQHPLLMTCENIITTY